MNQTLAWLAAELSRITIPLQLIHAWFPHQLFPLKAAQMRTTVGWQRSLSPHIPVCRAKNLRPSRKLGDIICSKTFSEADCVLLARSVSWKYTCFIDIWGAICAYVCANAFTWKCFVWPCKFWWGIIQNTKHSSHKHSSHPLPCVLSRAALAHAHCCLIWMRWPHTLVDGLDSFFLHTPLNMHETWQWKKTAGKEVAVLAVTASRAVLRNLGFC